MKRTIKLTENDLHNIIKESVNHILSELDWRTYQSAAEKANDRAHSLSNSDDIEEKQKRRRQARNLHNMAKEKANTQYGLDPNNVRFTTSKRNKDISDFHKGDSIYKDGKWGMK